MAHENQNFAWSDDLSVGHKKLDGQHKGLIKLINDFGQGAMPQSEMGTKLDAVIAYAARHFNDEEDYVMRKAPELLSQQAESHGAFIEKAYDFAHRFHDGEGDELRQDVYQFLSHWLVLHIQQEDQQYNKANPKPPAQ
jgi:hemerythrin